VPFSHVSRRWSLFVVCKRWIDCISFHLTIPNHRISSLPLLSFNFVNVYTSLSSTRHQACASADVRRRLIERCRQHAVDGLTSPWTGDRQSHTALSASAGPPSDAVHHKLPAAISRLLYTRAYYFARGSGCKVLWWLTDCVCVCVCLSARIYAEPYARSYLFLWMLPMTVARSFSRVTKSQVEAAILEGKCARHA